MGWLKIGARSTIVSQSTCRDDLEDLKYTIQQVEDINIEAEATIKDFPFLQETTKFSDLPFIPSTEVKRRTSKENGGLWIVIDNVVYDCTEFVNEHPGGEQVIKSFAGLECSWQFWRFHGKKDLEESGLELRVGRTEGMVNRFKEPKKYIGLRSRGLDEW